MADLTPCARLRRRAAELASRPYQAPADSLPQALAELSYDAYRDIRYRPTEALWLGDAPFSAQFFHPGFYYRHRVRIFEVHAAPALTPLRCGREKRPSPTSNGPRTCAVASNSSASRR